MVYLFEAWREVGQADDIGLVLQDQLTLNSRLGYLKAFEVVAAAATHIDKEDNFVVLLSALY